MITKWKLYNFKSIKKETELEFAPLTILAGANSCGKSTILQSILLICQTLKSETISKSVVLNGQLLKLGQFDDIKSFESTSDQILVGWELEPIREESSLSSFSLRSQSMPYYRDKTQIKWVSGNIAFDVKSSIPQELLQLNPQLFSFAMQAENISEDKVPVQSNLNILSRIYTPTDKDNIANDINLEGLNFQVSFDSGSLRELQEVFALVEPVGCMLYHFLPGELLVRYDEAEQDVKIIIGAIYDWNPRYVRQREYDINPEIPHEVLTILKSTLGEYSGFIDDLIHRTKGLFDENLIISLKDLVESMRSISPIQRREIRRILEESDLRERIRDVIIKTKDKKYNIVHTRYPRNIMRPSQYMYEYFSRKIKYLGPLRDEPRSLYPLVANIGPTDVGLKGEHTAAVLNSCKDYRVRYISPDNVGSPDKGFQITSRTLEAAVTTWLKYLGVAESVETKDRGKYGHEMKVMTAGTNTSQDLTHVGVGVSQVLPILVICLLADVDTTVIIEQPELHLHPMVQTRLADFFICMARLGVQCVIETHSEHIINRLRARIAEDPQNTLYNTAKIYFGDKENGQSIFTEVAVNKYGAIHNWPKNFFDQSQQETEKILKSALEKKKSERKETNG